MLCEKIELGNYECEKIELGNYERMAEHLHKIQDDGQTMRINEFNMIHIV